MLKYRFDVGDALERIGFNSYMAKTSGLLSQETLKKIKREDTNINAKSINNLCLLLDMQPKDIFIYVESPEDLELKKKLQKKIKYGTIVKSDKNQSLDLCNMHIYHCDLLCIINIWLLKGNQI